jgi:hypothetical protein
MRVSRAVWIYAAVSVALLASAPAARADDPLDGARIEVAPGIYLARASEQVRPSDPDGAGDAEPVAASAIGPAARPRVVGGTRTTIARRPWQVSIGYLPIDPHNAFKNHSCGGTLVAPNVVVTAAHCMTLGPNRNFRPPEEFQVVSGRTKLSSHKGQEHALADYYWFVDGDGTPLWNPETIEWDVVFLVLDDDANQDPIKIAGPGEEAVWAPGRRAFATGWGSTKAGTDAEIESKQSDVLRQARIEMISDPVCGSVYGPILFPDVMVCAGDLAGGVDVCSGDSGGPLVVPVAGGDHRLVGDTSFADGCGLPDTPGVYGRLAADPIRGALQNGIEIVTGADVVGSEAVPSNTFGFGRRTHQPRKAAARISVRVPGRGQLLLHFTKRSRGAVAWPREAGTAHLSVRPRFKTLRRMNGGRSGRVARILVRPRVTYTPMGGEPRTKPLRIHLVKRLRVG